MRATVQFDRHRTVPLDKFREELAFEFPTLPDEMFQHYLVRVARDMAEQAQIVRRKLTIPIQPCVTRYYLAVPDGLELKSLMSLRHVPTGNEENGSKEIPRFTGAPERITAFTRAAWLDVYEKVLTIIMPQAGGVCKAIVSAMPSRDACELPAEYYDSYFPTLIMGTRAQLLMLTGRPWTNVRMGGELHNEYRRQVADLGVVTLRNKEAGIIRMRHGRAL